MQTGVNNVWKPTEYSHYDAAGPDNANAILFLHVVAGTRKWWLPQMRAFSPEYRVLAPDLPGHGTRSNVPFRIDSLIDVIETTLDAAGKQRALLVGVSMGAYAAIAFAHHRPERVAGLVLSGCSINFTGAFGAGARVAAWLLEKTYPLSALLLRRRGNENIRTSTTPLSGQIIAGGTYFHGWPACLDGFSGVDFYANLRAYPGAIMIATGEHDFNRPFQVRLAAAAQHPKTCIIKGAAHTPNLDQPDRYNTIVRDFARALDWNNTVPAATQQKQVPPDACLSSD